MDATETLSMRVAEEIRAMLGRRRVTGRELARRIGVSQPWVSARLTGHVEIGLDDLEKIARALEVDIADLLPQPALRDGRRHDRTQGGINERSSRPAAIPTPRHPVGRPHTARVASGNRATGAPRTRPVWTHDGVAA